MLNFNEAEEQVDYSLIPANTIGKASLKLRYGDDPTDLYIVKSKTSDSAYLDCEWTIIDGPYARRKIFDKIGIIGSEVWLKMGKSRIRAILESAKNISSKDMSEAAVNARKIASFGELNDLEATIKIGIKTDKSSQYAPINCVSLVITPDRLDKDFLSSKVTSKSGFIDDDIPF
jgi:hypothetical protein